MSKHIKLSGEGKVLARTIEEFRMLRRSLKLSNLNTLIYLINLHKEKEEEDLIWKVPI